MPETWLLFAALGALGSIIFNYFNRYVLRSGADSTVYAWLFELIRSIFFLAAIPFGSFVIHSWSTYLLLLALGLTELLGVYLYMKMHAHTELSVSVTIQRLKVILVPLAAFFFLAERLTSTQYLGIIIIFLGCLAVAGSGNIRKTKGLWYTLGFVFVNTASNLLLKASTSHASTAIVTAAFSLPAAALIPFLMKSTKLRLPTAKNILKPTLLASAFNILTMYGVVSAYRLAPAGLVSGTFQGISTLSVLVGIVFLNERKHIPLKLTGAALTTIGIILLV